MGDDGLMPEKFMEIDDLRRELTDDGVSRPWIAMAISEILVDGEYVADGTDVYLSYSQCLRTYERINELMECGNGRKGPPSMGSTTDRISISVTDAMRTMLEVMADDGTGDTLPEILRGAIMREYARREALRSARRGNRGTPDKPRRIPKIPLSLDRGTMHIRYRS